jgi:hypothetical protein
MVSNGIAPSASTPTSPNTTTTQEPTSTDVEPLPAILPRHADHQALHNSWQQYFADAVPNQVLPILDDNLTPTRNVPWGPDTHSFLPDDGSFRIVWQNHNGFKRVNDSLPNWTATMDFLHGLHTSLFGFTEHNLQWDRVLLKEAKQLQRRFFDHGHLETFESALTFPTSYKPGGTCIGINGKWTTRMTESGTDPSGHGRWSYVILSGRALDVMFVSAYWVCQKAGSKVGPLTSYAQQWTMSRLAGNRSPDPRNDFLTDLIQFVTDKKAGRQLAVSILLDANETLGSDADGLQRLTNTLNLISMATDLDLMDRLHIFADRIESTLGYSL